MKTLDIFEHLYILLLQVNTVRAKDAQEGQPCYFTVATFSGLISDNIYLVFNIGTVETELIDKTARTSVMILITKVILLK